MGDPWPSAAAAGGREGSLKASIAALDAYGWKTELGPHSIQLTEPTEELASPYS